MSSSAAAMRVSAATSTAQRSLRVAPSPRSLGARRRPLPARLALARRVLPLAVRAHGQSPHGGAHGATSTAEKNKNTGFVAEMRKVAMKLHTREQAPKEGKAQPNQPMKQFAPTREGYLQFLVESKAVYGTLERIMAEASDPQYVRFQGTGLERSAALEKDIAWMTTTYGLEAPELQEDGPGITYCRLLEKLSVEEPPAFICHFYNTYFAHTAGGRMIGNKVAAMCLDGAELKFYEYDRDLVELLEAVRGQINEVAETWTREQKDRCLEETMESFKYSGGIMQTIMS